MPKAKPPIKQHRPCPGCGLGKRLLPRFQYMEDYRKKHFRLLEWKPGDPYLRNDLCSGCLVKGIEGQLEWLRRQSFLREPRLFTEEELKEGNSKQVEEL